MAIGHSAMRSGTLEQVQWRLADRERTFVVATHDLALGRGEDGRSGT